MGTIAPVGINSRDREQRFAPTASAASASSERRCVADAARHRAWHGRCLGWPAFLWFWYRQRYFRSSQEPYRAAREQQIKGTGLKSQNPISDQIDRLFRRESAIV